MKRYKTLLCVLAGSLALSGLVAATANATTTDQTDSRLEITNQGLIDLGDFVIVGRHSYNPDSSSVFIPLPESKRNATVVFLDTPPTELIPILNDHTKTKYEKLSLLQKLTEIEDSQRPMDDATWYTFGTPLGSVWSNSFYGGTLIGLDSSARHQYAWKVTEGANQHACAQGVGYYTGYNGRDFGIWRQWYGLSCGTEGGGSVPISNTYSRAEFKAKSTIVTTAATGLFR